MDTTSFQSGGAVKRRQFIRAATAAVLLPAVATPYVPARVSFSQERDYVFFDERFHEARRTVASWRTSGRRIAVQSDITPWKDGLDRITRHHALNLRGVTTDSFLFCLRILAAEHADLDVQVSRLDRDLLQWRMNTTPRTDYGTMRHG